MIEMAKLSFRSIKRAVVAALLFICSSLVAQDLSDAELANMLLDASYDDEESLIDRSRAFAQVQSLDPSELSPTLRMALISLLEQEARLSLERVAASRSGRPLSENFDPTFGNAVARVVVQLDDPLAIPALATALGGEPGVIDALASFGEMAVDDVLAVADSNQPPISRTRYALDTLRCMLHTEGGAALSSQSLDAIRALTFRFLTSEKSSFTVLFVAIDLALALNDSELKGLVESLANDEEAVNSILANGDERRAALVQGYAQFRLTGDAPSVEGKPYAVQFESLKGDAFYPCE